MSSSDHPLAQFEADWRPSQTAFRAAATDPGTRVPELVAAENQAQEESDRMKTWSSVRRRKAVHRIVERARWRAVQRLGDESRDVIAAELLLRPSARAIDDWIEQGHIIVPESVLDKHDVIHSAVSAADPEPHAGFVDASVWALALHASASLPGPFPPTSASRDEHCTALARPATATKAPTVNGNQCFHGDEPETQTVPPKDVPPPASAVCSRAGAVLSSTPGFAAFLSARFDTAQTAQDFLRRVISAGTRSADTALVNCGDAVQFAITPIPDAAEAAGAPAGASTEQTSFVSVAVLRGL